MKIKIATEDGTPLYKQVVTQIRHQIAAGQLKPGDELPTVRALAQKLLINPNTVARAYRDLESEGLVHAKRGVGTFIAEGVTRFGDRERKRLITERIDAMLVEGEHLGYPLEKLIELTRERHETFIRKPSKEETHHDNQ